MSRDGLGPVLAAVLESSDDAVIVETLEGVITYWNAGAAAMYGYAAGEMVGRNVALLAPPGRQDELAGIIARLVREERVRAVETQLVRKDGGVVDVSLSVTPVRDAGGVLVGAASVARDVTERNRAAAELREREEQMLQAERMETVGQLAGGLAHDFNNMLAAIMGFAGLIVDGSEDEGVRGDAEQILTAARRARRLTGELLTFSRRAPYQPELVDLNTVVRDASRMLAASMGSGVRAEVELAGSLPLVLADRGQLEQVVMNLAMNARDAMPAGGTVTVTTAATELAGGQHGLRADASPGPHVELAVSDTGCGMNEQVARRMFDPFFTTKPPGAGTGLGLPTVFGVVTQAGGILSVDTAEGAGTTVHVYLPVAEGPARSPQTAAQVPGREMPAGGEKVLVVDDEPAVLAVTARILRRAGYLVTEAAAGDEALSLLSGGGFDLLVTDTVMPGMSGTALAQRAGSLYPGLRIIHMSGSGHGISPDRIRRGEIVYLAKPFTSEQLLEKVRATLSAPAPG
jgi:two-component system cell cycle sensor histidine kinase/response regulator CckA